MHLAPVLWAVDLQVNKVAGVSASCWLPPCEDLLLWAWSSWKPALGWGRFTQEGQASVGAESSL